MSKPSHTGLAGLRLAETYVGTMEEPPGSNGGPDIDRWNTAAGVPKGSYWCMAFVRAMLASAGAEVLRTASVGFFLAWARADGLVVKRPRKGDIVCFFFDKEAPGWPSHVGFVKRVIGLRWDRNGRFVGYLRTIEGNTSSDDRGSQSNGGGVFERKRHIAKAEFVRTRP